MNKEKKSKKEKCQAKEVNTSSSEYAKKQKKQTAIGLTICVVLSAALGTGVGLILKSLSSNQRRDFDEDLYKDDFTVIKKKYQDALENQVEDLSTVLTPVEMVQISIDLLNDLDFFNECHGINNNNYSGNQVITSMKAVYQGNIYSETISYGKMVKTGTRYFQNKDSTQIRYFNANGKTFDVNEDDQWVYVSYDKEENTIEAQDYYDKFGSPLQATTALLISSKTVKPDTTPTSIKENDGYHIKIQLSDDATERYKTQIIATDSKVSNVTKFELMDIDCVLDNKLRLIVLDSYEKYETIALGVVSAICQSHLNYRYYYEDDGLDSSWLPTGLESYKEIKGER